MAAISTWAIFIIWACFLPLLQATTLYKQSLSQYPNAVCNDGSPAVYFIGNVTQTDHVLINLQGGGRCVTAEECVDRCKNSYWKKYCDTPKSDTLDLHGIMSSNSSINPAFADYLKVHLWYCSSDVHSGNRTASNETLGFHFKGKVIFTSLIEDLKKKINLSSAKRVVLTGSSAGGFGVTVNCDYLSTLIPGVSVSCIGDAPAMVPINMPTASPNCGGFRFAIYNFTLGGPLWHGIPDESCFNSVKSEDRYQQCIMAATAWRHIKNPLFLANVQFDTISIGNQCFNPAKLPNRGQDYLRLWGKGIDELAKQIIDENPKIGLFIPSAVDHVLEMSDETYGKVTVGPQSMTYAQLVSNWMNGTKPIHAIDDCGDLWCNKQWNCERGFKDLFGNCDMSTIRNVTGAANVSTSSFNFVVSTCLVIKFLYM